MSQQGWGWCWGQHEGQREMAPGSIRQPLAGTAGAGGERDGQGRAEGRSLSPPRPSVRRAPEGLDKPLPLAVSPSLEGAIGRPATLKA